MSSRENVPLQQLALFVDPPLSQTHKRFPHNAHREQMHTEHLIKHLLSLSATEREKSTEQALRISMPPNWRPPL